MINTSKTPEGFTSTFTPAAGYNIHAIEGGFENSKPPIVMIHGAIACRRYLVPTAILLAKQMPVFVPEMPGHGSSSKPARALSVPEHAEVLYQWIKLKQLERMHIFANSYGCQIAAQLVVSHPEIAISLILTDPVDPRSRSVFDQAMRLSIDAFMEPNGRRTEFLADAFDMGPVIVIGTVQRMLEDDIRTKLIAIKCPTLVVRGEKDPVAPQDWTEEISEQIPYARWSIIPNAPHCINYAAPHQLTRMIVEFINVEGI